MAEFDKIKYNDEYNKHAYDRVNLTIPKDKKSEWNEKAKPAGMSLNAYITQAVDSYAGISPDEDKIAYKALQEAHREIFTRIEQALKPYKIQKDEETTDE